ncbi:putative efflux protein, MATE family [Lachnospiraceae bacterium XBB1006]|nr:putative efflux protein, MATE family [Lachnospiraceae bacterium XBB1006]
MEQYERKYIEMTESPVERLVIRMAIPTIISMLISTFYNMADSFFVGKISTAAVGAVGVSFPIMTIIQAIGFFFGHGSGNYISFMLGNRRRKEAEEMAAVGFFAALFFGCFITIFGLLWLKPLAIGLGSTHTILPYSMQYLGIILIGAPYMTGALVINNHLRFQGNALHAMFGITSGAIINVLLDPVLIFGLKMGVRGAATATIISQFIAFGVLWSQTRYHGNIKLKLVNFKPTGLLVKEILKGGTPSLTRQALTGLSTVTLNLYARIGGDAAIAAMSIVQRIITFAVSALTGFGQGFQPVCGFNYGAEKYDRVKKAFWFCVKLGTAFLACASCILIIFAPQFITLFRHDPEVIHIGAFALRMQALTLPFSAWIVVSNMMMQNIGKVYKASFLAAARQGLFLIIVLAILTPIWGVLGIQMAQPIADLITLSVAIAMQKAELKELDEFEENGLRDC